MALHRALTGSAMHTPFRWTFADSVARLAASVTADDLNKLAWQQSDNTLWVLSAVGPTVWTSVGGGGSPQEAIQRSWMGI